MSDKTVCEVLTDGRAYIVQGWTRGALERDGRYCLIGAIHKAADENHELFSLAHRALSSAGHRQWLGPWNDKQKTKQPVLALFDKAIEACR